MTKNRKSFYALLGIPPKHKLDEKSDWASRTFDPEHKYVTSPIFRNPFIFGGLRIIVALYILITTIIFLEEYVSQGNGDSYLSYFTNLTYIGLCAYFFASGVQTICYALRWRRNGAGAGYPLQQSWPRFLQALHVILYSTVITFPFIVTIVYWALLGGPHVWETTWSSWNAVSVHILNAFFAACELVFTNSPPVPWITLPVTILLLGSYLGVAYITYETQGFYTYSFLDPSEDGSGKLLPAYVIGIAVGQCILFTVVHFIAVLRQKLAAKYKRVIVLDESRKAKRRKGKARGGKAKAKDAEEGEEREGLGEPEGLGEDVGGVDGEGRRSKEEEDDDDAYIDIDENEWEPVQHPNSSRPEMAERERDLERGEGAGVRTSAGSSSSPRKTTSRS
ncbi:hypothetical protein CC1G_10469 [Coprinopsis cinerea okayama7|uniref:Uncharacterized protein n=1 Tax=Coprinopsis cinerea (strain Okayama-7 / 130 / ATCC MYA-4618 / FGSC 9003) TaxID=240176 RepID=A8NL25_COPC7|nr:hypothetical protein CC1G_10469 [Coprinopsis cinerea okayama7\|eukprot:XP_001834595.1 hypothetical protein CC1G_10469 [Coprinopsis cinerea okayama7\